MATSATLAAFLATLNPDQIRARKATFDSYQTPEQLAYNTNPRYNAALLPSWDNLPYLDDNTNEQLLGPKPPGARGSSNPLFQGSMAASWSNPPFLDDDANVKVLGPKPADIGAYDKIYGTGGPSTVAATVQAVLSPSLPLPAKHKTILLIGVAVLVVMVAPTLFKKARK